MRPHRQEPPGGVKTERVDPGGPVVPTRRGTPVSPDCGGIVPPMSESARLYLITPPLTEAGPFLPRLEAALDAGDVACVLLRTATADEGDAKALVRALGPAVQQRGAALLVEGDTRFAGRTEADGLHVAGVGLALDEALEALRPKKIVGVGGLQDRDSAMAAGESGADYLMFGFPGDGQDVAAVAERVAWWAEIFNVPCVGYCADPAQAGAIGRAGAEFVALCEGFWDDPAAVLATVTRDLGALDEPVR